MYIFIHAVSHRICTPHFKTVQRKIVELFNCFDERQFITFLYFLLRLVLRSIKVENMWRKGENLRQNSSHGIEPEPDKLTSIFGHIKGLVIDWTEHRKKNTMLLGPIKSVYEILTMTPPSSRAVTREWNMRELTL
jgi:hypothetical protein